MEAKPPTRPPAVAGRFYPDDPRVLSRQVTEFLERGRSPDGAAPVAATAVMAPHAGYMYSGGVAGMVFARIEVPRRVVVLAPNHTGLGPRISVFARGRFGLPGGDLPVDEELAAAVLEEVPGAVADREAHRLEHAVEVELPFLRARRPDVEVVAIVLGGLDADRAIAAGEGLWRARQRAGAGEMLLVASSDMSHYLTDEETRQIDPVALEPLLAADARRLHRTVVDRDISMCGFIPATAMLAYARLAGGGAPVLAGYATSGDAGGGRDRVVGYAGVIIPGAEPSRPSSSSSPPPSP